MIQSLSLTGSIVTVRWFCLLVVGHLVACLRPVGCEWIRRRTSAKNSVSVSENRQAANLLIRKMKFLLSFISLENSSNEGMRDSVRKSHLRQVE